MDPGIRGVLGRRVWTQGTSELRGIQGSELPSASLDFPSCSLGSAATRRADEGGGGG